MKKIIQGEVLLLRLFPQTTTITMPLRYTDDPASLDSVKNAPEEYIVFYSSRDAGGKLWCPVRTL